MFSPNTPAGKRVEVMQALDIQRETMNERYLGLPVYVGRSKSNVFGYLKDRIWKRIQGWKERMLSEGRERSDDQSSSTSHTNFRHGMF